ncbi:hypothetical protein E2C01_058513 [Portunus trituberculatus]|uniref:Endonuclease/exonuclease/phosphatase domain-containing protein n=1 Tax=Portunus trituberculatus TaxID=210409 RepID=A0A5B7H5K6_PORTR|nr:hypothetical protein [Portunus trituberculatus]
MVTPNPASEFPSEEGTRNVPRSDCSLGGDPKCLDTSLNFFFINFWNIREISILGDFNVHHQLWLSSPFNDHPDELAFNFAIFHDLERAIPDREVAHKRDNQLFKKSTDQPGTQQKARLLIFLRFLIGEKKTK